jgi:hypothetical protein
MKKKRIIIAIVAIILLFVAIQVVLYNEIPALKDPYGDEWYDDAIKQFVFDYIRQTENIDEKLQLRSYSYTDFDGDIVKQNRENPNKKYPFSAVTVVADTKDMRYTVYLFVDSNEDLKVEKYEKQPLQNDWPIYLF